MQQYNVNDVTLFFGEELETNDKALDAAEKDERFEMWLVNPEYVGIYDIYHQRIYKITIEKLALNLLLYSYIYDIPFEGSVSITLLGMNDYPVNQPVILYIKNRKISLLYMQSSNDPIIIKNKDESDIPLITVKYYDGNDLLKKDNIYYFKLTNDEINIIKSGLRKEIPRDRDIGFRFK